MRATARIFIIAILFTCAPVQASVRSIVSDIDSHFTWKAEEAGKNHTQTPEYTMRIGFGDCEDYVMLVRYKLIIAGADPSEIQVLQGKLNGLNHMVLRYKGYWIDCFGMHKRYPNFVITQVWSSPVIESILRNSAKVESMK